MRILFAAGDVGGARSILPVARLASTRGHHVSALQHGVLATEGDPAWTWHGFDQALDAVTGMDMLIYATSVSDQKAVQTAARARHAGVPCLHVLDNWSSYAERISGIVPDAYAVMDELAQGEAIAAGVPEHIIHVTGHPNLGTLADEAQAYPALSGKTGILFVSEPARADQGPSGRGYDEAGVAEALVAGLARCRFDDATLWVAPHPREDRADVTARMTGLMQRHGGFMPVRIVPADQVRSCLHGASHVAGMTSILLYESWLLGRPTLSLQPGLCVAGLRTLSRRQGVFFHDRKAGTDETIGKWLAAAPGRAQPALSRHRDAAENVLALAVEIKKPSIK
ncbi:hypothetical protein [Hoeflea ulvae]|uniref:UDP-N-acetylglucosamine 2-epimerase domain-containing protein n=1 Tax=Hoeflea ulvae TaxID=2983764 RepID=A0ABT3YAZ5_9HYPH|nr:hypothetical protein [Hoeflea ulvae]MCY0093048.1 hypothetical protein [Hoeflea ulvae]